MATVQRGSVLDVRGPDRVILPALLLTLDKYSPGEWGQGRVVPVIRSAVQHSLLRSDLVAEPDSY